MMVNKGMDGWLYLDTKYSTENTPKYAKKRKPTQKYFNFVPMLESRNVHHVKSNCS